MKNYMQKFEKVRNDAGDVARPLLLWILGVPGGLVLILWFFFFRGK